MMHDIRDDESPEIGEEFESPFDDEFSNIGAEEEEGLPTDLEDIVSKKPLPEDNFFSDGDNQNEYYEDGDEEGEEGPLFDPFDEREAI